MPTSVLFWFSTSGNVFTKDYRGLLATTTRVAAMIGAAVLTWPPYKVRLVVVGILATTATATTAVPAGGWAATRGGARSGGTRAWASGRSASSTTYLGPLACSAADCPKGEWGRPVNNTNFHLRDVMITWGGDGALLAATICALPCCC
jgi:hypothetical protein